MDTKIKGKCLVVKPGMTVYEIIPETRWTMDRLDPIEMSNWVFETILPGAENKSGFFKSLGYSIIIAGADFGCGSKSVEHPMAALKGAEIKLVIADSFSRYSYRNAINLGLPVLTYPGIAELISSNDEIEVDLIGGVIKNLTNNSTIQIAPLSQFAYDLLSAGSLLNYCLQEHK